MPRRIVGALVAATVFAAPAYGQQAPNVIVENSFRGERNWPVKTSGACLQHYAEGGYVIDSRPSRQHCYASTSAEIGGAYRVEVLARWVAFEKDSALSVVFGVGANAQVLHSFTVDPVTGDVSIQYLSDGSFQLVSKFAKTPALNLGVGAANRLAVDVRGGTITYSANGSVVGTARTPHNTNGRVGVSTESAAVVFNDLRVLALDTPTSVTGPGGRAAAPTSYAPGTRAQLDDLSTEHWLKTGVWGSCESAYRDGGFVIANNSVDRQCSTSVFSLNRSSDVRVQVTTRRLFPASNAAAGLFFADPDGKGNELVAFMTTPSGEYRLSRRESSGKWTGMLGWAKHPAIRTESGASNTLAVEISGGEVRAFINRQYVGSVPAAVRANGHLGPYTNAGGVQVVFTNLEVTFLHAGAAASGTRAQAGQSGDAVRSDGSVIEASTAAASGAADAAPLPRSQPRQ